MNEHKVRNTVIVSLLLFIVIFVHYFYDIVDLIIPRYCSPYWSMNTISAIMEMYSKSPCVSKVRFYQYGNGTRGVLVSCDMRWDATPEDAVQTYKNLRAIIISDEFLSELQQDFFSDINPSDFSPDSFRLILESPYFIEIDVIYQNKNTFFENACYRVVESETGFELMKQYLPPRSPRFIDLMG